MAIAGHPARIPTYAAALAFCNSGAYQEARQVRLRSSPASVLAMDGIAESLTVNAGQHGMARATRFDLACRAIHLLPWSLRSRRIYRPHRTTFWPGSFRRRWRSWDVFGDPHESPVANPRFQSPTGVSCAAG